ncbi:hypothetical protein D3C83_57000 [compost metagenome]
MSVANAAGVTAGDRSVATPSAEGGQQGDARLGGQRFFGKTSQRLDRLEALIEERAARVAPGKVGVEARAIVGRQSILEILGDQLDQLATRQFREIAIDHDASVAAR